ncbi:MAG: PEP-CTERM sorting domain-containing protein [Symploca sp. SIO2C1]|nr:PEP-CTERM sorting domain-containing protein [Symploca sp. SIO2C1]
MKLLNSSKFLPVGIAAIGTLAPLSLVISPTAEAASLKTITASAFAQTRSSDADFPFFFTFSFPDQPGIGARAVAVSVADTSVGRADAFASSTAIRTATGNLLFSTQERQEILRRTPGALQAFAVTNADAAPAPFESPALPNVVNEEGTPLSIEEKFESDLNTSLEITFNDEADQIFFDFLGSALLKTEGLFDFSTGIRLESVGLGLLRSFTINESFELAFQGDWGLDDLSVTQDRSSFFANLDNLDFAIPVASEFTREDFQNLDFRFNGSGIVEAASVPEPASLFGFLSVGIIGTGSAVSRLRRKDLSIN